MPVQRVDELGREVHGAALMRLGRLDTAEADRTLDIEGPPSEIDVIRLQRQNLARA